MKRKDLSKKNEIIRGHVFAEELRTRFPHQTPDEIAEACGIRLNYEKLPLVFGQVAFLAEACLQPPSLTINTIVIAKLTANISRIPERDRCWFTESAITNVVIAHELYHLLANQPSSRAAELEAHEFAQTLTGLPFSPSFYENILKQTTKCRNTTNIIWE